MENRRLSAAPAAEAAAAREQADSLKEEVMEQAREIYGLLSKTVVSIDKTELADVNVVLQELLIGDEWIVVSTLAHMAHLTTAIGLTLRVCVRCARRIP